MAELSHLLARMSACKTALGKRLDKAAADRGMSLNELLVLHECLHADVTLDQRELSRRIGASAAQISGIVERLSDRGLISSHRPRSDRRRQVWSVSEKGQQCLQWLDLSEQRFTLNPSSDFSHQDAEFLVVLLKRLSAAFIDFPDVPARVPSRKEAAA